MGTVEPSRKLAEEIREIDVYYPLSLPPTIPGQALGLLWRFAATSALFEPFRNAVKTTEVLSYMSKLFDVYAQMERQAKSDRTP